MEHRRAGQDAFLRGGRIDIVYRQKSDKVSGQAGGWQTARRNRGKLKGLGLRILNRGPRVSSALSFIGGVLIAACLKFDMFWLNSPPIPVGRRVNFPVQMISTCLPSRRGRGWGTAPCGLGKEYM
jgi:hypothetical protein